MSYCSGEETDRMKRGNGRDIHVPAKLVIACGLFFGSCHAKRKEKREKELMSKQTRDQTK